MLPVIVTDLDGVVADIMSVAIEKVWKGFGVLLSPEDVTEFDMGKACFPRLSQHFVSAAAFNAWLTRHVWESTAAFAQVRPYWHVLRAYQEFQEAGGVVVPVTSRASKCIGTTEAWCRSRGLGTRMPSIGPNLGGLVKCNGTTAGKLSALVEVYHYFNSAGGPGCRPIWYIEDRQSTVLRALAMRTGGKYPFPQLSVFMPPQPWNAGGVQMETEELARAWGRGAALPSLIRQAIAENRTAAPVAVEGAEDVKVKVKIEEEGGTTDGKAAAEADAGGEAHGA